MKNKLSMIDLIRQLVDLGVAEERRRGERVFYVIDCVMCGHEGTGLVCNGRFSCSFCDVDMVMTEYLSKVKELRGVL